MGRGEAENGACHQGCAQSQTHVRAPVFGKAPRRRLLLAPLWPPTPATPEDSWPRAGRRPPVGGASRPLDKLKLVLQRIRSRREEKQVGTYSRPGPGPSLLLAAVGRGLAEVSEIPPPFPLPSNWRSSREWFRQLLACRSLGSHSSMIISCNHYCSNVNNSKLQTHADPSAINNFLPLFSTAPPEPAPFLRQPDRKSRRDAMLLEASID